MMKTYVAWQSYRPTTPNRGYWDMAMIEEIFSRQIWSPVCANEFVHVDSIQDVPRDADGCIMVLAARHHAHEQYIDKIHDDLARFRWCILMLMGDEESEFPVWRLKLRNAKIYVQMPRDQQNMHAKMDVGLPNGYPTDLPKYRGKFRQQEFDKPLDWAFAGQDTHFRRHVFVEYAQSIGGMPGPEFGTKAVLYRTEGFTQGIDHEKYYAWMASAKIIPCPCGAAAPDSFRFAEALEFGCIPFADNKSSDHGYPPGYWKFLFKEDPPFPTIDDDWREFPSHVIKALAEWPANANRIGAWWAGYKRRLTYQLESDINSLRGSMPEATSLKDKITVLISSSPIPSHPSPRMIFETITSVREHLPECEIIIMQDGVRPEQEHMRAAYEEYKRQLLLVIRNDHHNVLPIFYDEFLHQAEMTRRTLDYIKTPYLLYLEHDTPLCKAPIEWEGIVKVVESGWAESVRLAHMDCEFIHPEHMHLMIDSCRQDVCGIQCMRTRQYSQRAHVCSVDYYRRLLSHFSSDCRTFIEDRAYTLFESGNIPFKLAIYTPDGPIKRSRDLNGREGGHKFVDKLRF